MKSHSIVFLAAVSLVMASQGQTTVSSRPPMREAPTNEELIVKLRQSEQQMAAAAVARPASSPIDPRANQPLPDLFNSSEILCYNGAFTLVPKRAVLEFPQNLRDRLKVQQGAKVQSWSDFYIANRNWITTVEVSKSQASGAKPLAEETSAHIAKCGKLVVATFQGHPISVHPVPVPETPAKSPALLDSSITPASSATSTTSAVSKP